MFISKMLKYEKSLSSVYRWNTAYWTLVIVMVNFMCQLDWASESRSVMSHSFWPPTRHLCPWNEFSRQEHWSGLPCSPPGDPPNPGIEPVSLRSPVLAGGFFTTSITCMVHRTLAPPPRWIPPHPKTHISHHISFPLRASLQMFTCRGPLGHNWMQGYIGVFWCPALKTWLLKKQRHWTPLKNIMWLLG